MFRTKESKNIFLCLGCRLRSLDPVRIFLTQPQKNKQQILDSTYSEWRWQYILFAYAEREEVKVKGKLLKKI